MFYIFTIKEYKLSIILKNICHLVIIEYIYIVINILESIEKSTRNNKTIAHSHTHTHAQKQNKKQSFVSINYQDE